MGDWNCLRKIQNLQSVFSEINLFHTRIFRNNRVNEYDYIVKYNVNGSELSMDYIIARVPQ